MTLSPEHLKNTVQQEHARLTEILKEMETVIVGQPHLLQRMLLALCANGHVLIEGIPGLGKTLAVKTFAAVIQAQFQRIQFTPDILPTDLTGAPIYVQQTGSFVLQKGPMFTNILLADEINRAPAKVQSALLEVMEERQITIGQTTYRLEEPFMVLATQNPIEHDGTYDLPESQLDRFLLKIRLSYPSRADEERILRSRAVAKAEAGVQRLVTPEYILQIRRLVDAIHLDARVEAYALNIIEATRFPEKYKLQELAGVVEYGASPRAAINLVISAKAHALLAGRAYVTPEDLLQVGEDVLSHRIILKNQAGGGITKEDVVRKVLDRLERP